MTLLHLKVPYYHDITLVMRHSYVACRELNIVVLKHKYKITFRGLTDFHLDIDILNTTNILQTDIIESITVQTGEQN